MVRNNPYLVNLGFVLIKHMQDVRAAASQDELHNAVGHDPRPIDMLEEVQLLRWQSDGSKGSLLPPSIIISVRTRDWIQIRPTGESNAIGFV